MYDNIVNSIHGLIIGPCAVGFCVRECVGRTAKTKLVALHLFIYYSISKYNINMIFLCIINIYN